MISSISFDDAVSFGFGVGDRGYLVHNVVWIGVCYLFFIVFPMNVIFGG
jgi:hypothetical protein